MYINNKSIVYPVKTLVRNNGFDGSGLNCEDNRDMKKGNNSHNYNYFEQEFNQFEFKKMQEVEEVLIDKRYRKQLDKFYRISKKIYLKVG